MKPFDSPALAGAQIEAKKLNARKGPHFVIKVCNHQLKKQQSCAAQLIQQGAQIGYVTCDVEYAAPAVQEFLNHGMLTMSPCVSTDQMGPSRFGPKGRLAFSMGGTGQDEGSAEAEYAWARGLEDRDRRQGQPARLLPQRLGRLRQALPGARRQDRRPQSFTSFKKDIGPVISKVAGEKADVISFVTAFGELPQFVGGIRSAGNNTPIINSWGGDGTYWNPKSPQVTDYYVDNYASSFGDDPNPAVNALLKALLAAKQVPYTASYVLGASDDRRARDRPHPHVRLDAGHEARAGARGLPRRPDDLRADLILEDAAQRRRPALADHEGPEQQGVVRPHVDDEVGDEDPLTV